MSLELVINEKTIKNRHLLLSNYLKNNNVGVLSENEAKFFKHIFEKFYTPDEQYTKFNVFQISTISIVKDNYGNKCFSILVDNNWYPTSIKRLSGGNRNDKANLIRSLRNAIEPQITTFRVCNPLNPDDICPVTKKMLGRDAEVDHHIPFYILAEEWIKNHNNISYIYVLDKFEYILQEPHYTLWSNFHFDKAILRWVSKEGNKFAHKLYSR
jgi:hypothetical protein